METVEEYERWLHGYAFQRIEERHARLKRQLDCGCWIDASEPYRYQVWRLNDSPRGTLEQRTDCEFCARIDLAG